MIPTHKTQISMTFDEYVVVKDVQNLYLSPPLEKTPKYKMRNKSLIVYFESDLDSNKTYVLDVSNAIADNNEGNMYPGYALVFSTGRQVDSMMMTGIVQDCNTLMPVKGATVMLYKDHSDSAIFKHRPDAAIKTDDWGFFCLRNIQDTLYRMYAIMDMNNNNIYEADQEQVAFLDTVVRPAQKVNDSLPELKKYIMTDTVACLARKTQYEMNLFKEVPSKQMILNKGRLGERTAYITFMAPYAQIDSIWMTGIPSDKLITLREEMDICECYIQLQRLRHDRLQYEIHLDSDVDTGMLLPAMIIQPVVENCFIHAYRKKDEDIQLSVDVSVDGTDLLIEVSDNGDGIPAAMLSVLRQRLEEEGNEGIGLANIHKRLSLMYGPGYGMAIESEYGLGTIVTLRLPTGGL